MLAATLVGTLIVAILARPPLSSQALFGAIFVLIPSMVAYSLLMDRGKSDRGSDSAGSDRYEALCDAAGQLVMHHGQSGGVLSLSGDVRDLFDVDPSSLMGERFLDRIHSGDRASFLQAFDCARRGDQTVSTSLRFRTGEVGAANAGLEEPVFAWAEIRVRRFPASALGSERADTAVVVSLMRNITEAKDTERRLETARAEALMAVTMKDRLLANVGHELRTPLNAILGFSEILGDPELTPANASKKVEYARIIHSSAEHLLSVVNLVLDMSKIEAGKFEIAPEPFDLEPLIKDCCDMLRLKAESGKVALAKSSMTDLQEITADKRACRQILLNLMSNAIKFTPKGGRVVVDAHIVDDCVHIHVIDTGIGIAPEDLPRLGSPFYQVRSGYDRGFEGAGLGLSLVRGLVGLHGGTVLLESAVGVGTRVTVRLPTDCRNVSRAGAPQLETAALPNIQPNPTFWLVGAKVERDVEEERKIA